MRFRDCETCHDLKPQSARCQLFPFFRLLSESQARSTSIGQTVWITRAKNILRVVENDEPDNLFGVVCNEERRLRLRASKSALSRKRREIDLTELVSGLQRFRPRRLCKRRGFVGLFPTEAPVL